MLALLNVFGKVPLSIYLFIFWKSLRMNINSFSNVWSKSPMKLSGPEFLFVERFMYI